MLRAVVRPVEVNVQNHTGPSALLVLGAAFIALLGSIVVAATAYYAARLAAETANARQKEQLDHDLEVRKQEHVRDALDFAVQQVHEVMSDVVGAEVELGGLDSARKALQGSRADPRATLGEIEAAEIEVLKERMATRESLLKANELHGEMLGTSIRLALRLGEKTPIPEAFDAVYAAWDAQMDLLRAALDGDEPRSDEQVAAYKQLDEINTRPYKEFHARCEAWFTARPTGRAAQSEPGPTPARRP